MDRQFSLEERKIWTSPVTGSSISPVSPATFERRLARTSAAAVSNYADQCARVKYNSTAHTDNENSEKPTHQRKIIGRRLVDLVRELGIEGVEVLDGDGDMVAVVY